MESATSRREFLSTAAVAALPSAATQARAGLLAGKRAVIYGAGGAMGSAVARAFAREGTRLFLAGRTLQNVQALADELARCGANASAARLDALDRAAVDGHLEDVVRAAGGIDISFNLIGLGGQQGQPLTGMSQSVFAEPIENAMRAHFHTATAAARHMEKRGAGVLLALTAQVARKPYVGSGGFGVACAAIESLWRQLAIELGPRGIRCVTLRSSGSPDAPGVRAAIEQHARGTGISRAAFETRIAEKTMLRHMPMMAEIADAAVLAASDYASSMTATVLNATCGEIAD
jgi:NAD(P)-dependent dehydrogenase (short-subunit alcohol dehydrogenase family)